MDKSSKTELKMISLIIFVAVSLVMIGGWFIYATNSTPSKVTIGDNQQDISIKKNQEFMINLVSNPSTGYSWSVNDNYDKSVIGLVSNEFKSADTELVGASGHDQWIFNGLSNGNTKLEFTYGRSWEKDPAQENVKSYNVTVQ
jgi:predicted secreted protein